MILAYLACTWVPYQLYSAFVGPAFAVGWRSWWVAAWHLLIGAWVAYRALPGHRERVAAWQAIAAVCIAAGALFAVAPRGGYQRYEAEYIAITGACFVACVQCGLATAWGIWRKGK